MRKEKTTTTTNRYLGAAITGSVRTKLKKKKDKTMFPQPNNTTLAGSITLLSHLMKNVHLP